MRKYKIALAAVLASTLLAFNLHAQTVTATLPATFLENFELQTNTIIVKAFSAVGTITLTNTKLSIHADEANDVSHNQKAYGITIALSGTTSAGDPARISLVVDYDELDSLADAIDYVGKVSSGVTQLNSFEAGYVTKSGFHVIAHSDRRQGSVNTFLQFNDLPRFPVSSDQLSQLHSLIAQAKTTLDTLK
jgi:hypothetical protein